MHHLDNLFVFFAGGWKIHHFDNLFVFLQAVGTSTTLIIFLQAVGPCTTWIIYLFFCRRLDHVESLPVEFLIFRSQGVIHGACTMSIFGKYVEIFLNGLTLANYGWRRPIFL